MQEATIFYGSVIGKSDDYLYNFKVLNAVSGDECKEPDVPENIKVDPYALIVNGIAYDAGKVSSFFVEKNLISKKQIFIARSKFADKYTGELYKVPLAAGISMRIPAALERYIKNDLKAFYKMAV